MNTVLDAALIAFEQRPVVHHAAELRRPRAENAPLPEIVSGSAAGRPRGLMRRGRWLFAAGATVVLRDPYCIPLVLSPSTHEPSTRPSTGSGRAVCTKDPSANKGVNYGRRGARLARREELAYREYGSDEQRSQTGCIGVQS